MARLLLVDDEDNVLAALKRTLGPEPYAIGASSAPATALMLAEKTAFDLVIADYRMPGVDGVTFLRVFKRQQPEAVRMVLSAYADFEALKGAINEAEIYRFLTKPWDDDTLKHTIAQALLARAARSEERLLAELGRQAQTPAQREEMARRQLESECPGITRVRYGADGAVLLEDDRDKDAEKGDSHGGVG